MSDDSDRAAILVGVVLVTLAFALGFTIRTSVTFNRADSFYTQSDTKVYQYTLDEADMVQQRTIYLYTGEFAVELKENERGAYIKLSPKENG